MIDREQIRRDNADIFGVGRGRSRSDSVEVLSLLGELVRVEAERDRLREAIRDALTVFADTEWAAAYGHLWNDDDGPISEGDRGS